MNSAYDSTIVSAADGYGKTVLVSTWLDTLVMAHTWLTLDASHNDPSLFAAYFLAAIRKLAPDVGRDLQALLVPTESDSAEIADYLIGEVDGIERPMIVVLDNYQSITANEVHAIVEKLIQQMPLSAFSPDHTPRSAVLIDQPQGLWIVDGNPHQSAPIHTRRNCCIPGTETQCSAP